jgi:hypothetical protein
MVKQYRFTKPYKHAPSWAKTIYHFDRGHVITRDDDGWFALHPKGGELRCSPVWLAQMQIDGFLEPIENLENQK